MEPYSPWMNWAKGENGMPEDALLVHHEVPSVPRDPLVLWYGIHLGTARADCMPWIGEPITAGMVDWQDTQYFRVHRF